MHVKFMSMIHVYLDKTRLYVNLPDETKVDSVVTDPLVHPWCFCLRLHILLFGNSQKHGSLPLCGDADDTVR